MPAPFPLLPIVRSRQVERLCLASDAPTDMPIAESGTASYNRFQPTDLMIVVACKCTCTDNIWRTTYISSSNQHRHDCHFTSVRLGRSLVLSCCLTFKTQDDRPLRCLCICGKQLSKPEHPCASLRPCSLSLPNCTRLNFTERNQIAIKLLREYFL